MQTFLYALYIYQMVILSKIIGDTTVKGKRTHVIQTNPVNE